MREKGYLRKKQRTHQMERNKGKLENTGLVSLEHEKAKGEGKEKSLVWTVIFEGHDTYTVS